MRRREFRLRRPARAAGQRQDSPESTKMFWQCKASRHEPDFNQEESSPENAADNFLPLMRSGRKGKSSYRPKRLSTLPPKRCGSPTGNVKKYSSILPGGRLGSPAQQELRHCQAFRMIEGRKRDLFPFSDIYRITASTRLDTAPESKTTKKCRSRQNPTLRTISISERKSRFPRKTTAGKIISGASVLSIQGENS